MARLATFGLLLLGGGSSADFLPFADVEELKPARLDPYCESAQEDGFRWCSRSIRKKLHDGGDVEMSWKMHVNPQHILSLDTEAEHGVRVTKCSPGELELEVPQTHEMHMEAGRFIVGSHFVHGCQHLTKKHMYHRLKQVLARHVPVERSQRRFSRYHLATETLPSFAHTARHISFNFSYMPIEARMTQEKYPEMRTDFGQHQGADRRLFSFPSFGGSTQNTGNFQSGGQASGGINTQDGILNLGPKQMSNFGWNWDFFMNDAQTPHFTVDQPGTKGSFIVRNPYIKAHAGCFLNFTSLSQGFMKPPHVQWRAGLKGHGIVQGRLEAAMNSTRSMDLEAQQYQIPKSVQKNFPFLRLLSNFDEPKWFSPIQNSVGNLPMNMEPGFQFQMSVYHKGPFSGYLAFGGSTHGTIEPVLHFDSLKGFKNTFNGELLDTDMWPPMWMVFTKAFEMGVKGEPTMLLKGDFMGFNDAQAAIKMAVYSNVTVQRSGAVQFDVDAQKELVVYPLRVMGITTLDFDTKYSVKVSVLGQEAESTPAINWGEVEFHDKASKFNMGAYTDSDVENQEIAVTLYKVSTSTGSNTTLGQGTFMCASFDKGVCQPPEAFVSITDSAGTEVAVVELSVIHWENPNGFLASKIMGVGMSFPSLSVNMATLQSAFPTISTSDPLKLHLIQGGRTYLADVAGQLTGSSPTLQGTTMIELYPGFIENWAPCTAGLSLCNSPKVELYSGSTLIGSGDLPQLGQAQVQSTGFLGKLVGAATTTAPPMMPEHNSTLPQVTLYAPRGSLAVAMLDVQARLTNPVQSSLFMLPAFASQIPLTQTTQFMWTIADAASTQSMDFTLTPLKIASSSTVAGQDISMYRQVNDKFMIPVADASQTVPASCQQRSVNGLPASAMPCSFVKELAFDMPTFSAGDQLIILVTWVQNGITHKIYSPPFEIVSASRRLSVQSEEPATPRWLQTMGVPSSEFSMAQNIDDNDPNCKRKDLQFNLGQGMMVRGEIISVGNPKDLPSYVVQDDSSGPMYATPWQSVGGAQPAVTASDHLPKQACEFGMCNSMLPGCRQAQFKKMHFPKLVFNYSRRFYYNGTNLTNGGSVGPMVRNGMAWAFSAMPGAVTVMLREMKTRQNQQQSAAPDYGFGNSGNNNQNTYGSSNPQQNWFGSSNNQQMQNNQQTQNTQQLPGAFGSFWNTQRRLTEQKTAVDQDGRPAKMPQKLESHQVRVEFKEGLPYIVNHQLVSAMTRHGFFQDIDDGFRKEKGELKIVGFYLEDGGSITIPNNEGAEPTSQGAGVYIAATAGLAVVGIAAAIALRSKRAIGYEFQTHEVEAGME